MIGTIGTIISGLTQTPHPAYRPPKAAQRRCSAVEIPPSAARSMQPSIKAVSSSSRVWWSARPKMP